MEVAVRKRFNAFAFAHRRDEKRQAYLSAFRHALSVIAKAEAKSWQETFSSLSPKLVYSILRSIASSTSSSSFSSHFLNYSFSLKLASVYAAH